MPAKSKPELLSVTEKEFSILKALVQKIENNAARRPDADGVSIKDIIAHRAHWIDLFLGWYKDGQAGKEVHFPAKGYKWNELPRYNADLRARQQDLGWCAACEALMQAHDELWDFLQSLDNAQLYGGPMKGGKNQWTTGRWAEAAGPSHYRSATKYIKQRLKNP